MCTLSTQSFEQVKQFLTDYSIERAKNGFVLIQDSLAYCFLDALCTTLNFNIVASTSDMEPQLPEQGALSFRCSFL